MDNSGEFPVVAALIPARGGSKGLHRKNLQQVGGMSLVARSIAVARSLTSISQIVVSSDDSETLEEASRYGAHTRERPPHIAEDATPMRAVIDDFLDSHDSIDIVVLLQPTSPLRSAEDIRRCLVALEGASVAVTVNKTAHPRGWLFDVDDQGHLEPIFGWTNVPTRRQEVPATYELNGAVYAARTSHLAGGGQILGPETVGIEIPATRAIDVDTQTDLEIARLLHRLESSEES